MVEHDRIWKKEEGLQASEEQAKSIKAGVVSGPIFIPHPHDLDEELYLYTQLLLAAVLSAPRVTFLGPLPVLFSWFLRPTISTRLSLPLCSCPHPPLN